MGDSKYVMVRFLDDVSETLATSMASWEDTVMVKDHGADSDEVDVYGAVELLAAGKVQAAVLVLQGKMTRQEAAQPVTVRKVLDAEQLTRLAEDLGTDGPVGLPDGVDEDDTLERLRVYHPDVHVAERTEKDGVLLHR